MLRLRFSVGLLFGLLVGVPIGAVIALLAFPRTTSESTASTSLQVQDLSRKLETANVDRARVDQQLEQFQKLAEQMTASFNSLEVRFRSLAEERARDAQAKATPVRAAPVAPAQRLHEEAATDTR